jgi:hypothetical protein
MPKPLEVQLARARDAVPVEACEIFIELLSFVVKRDNAFRGKKGQQCLLTLVSPSG